MWGSRQIIKIILGILGAVILTAAITTKSGLWETSITPQWVFDNRLVTTMLGTIPREEDWASLDTTPPNSIELIYKNAPDNEQVIKDLKKIIAGILKELHDEGYHSSNSVFLSACETTCGQTKTDWQMYGLVKVAFIPTTSKITIEVAGPRLPKYDVNARCTYHTADAEGTALLRGDCLTHEQGGYDYLTTVWDEVSPKSKAECLKMVDAVGLYSLLADCIQPRLELEQLKNHPSFHN